MAEVATQKMALEVGELIPRLTTYMVDGSYDVLPEDKVYMQPPLPDFRPGFCTFRGYEGYTGTYYLMAKPSSGKSPKGLCIFVPSAEIFPEEERKMLNASLVGVLVTKVNRASVDGTPIYVPGSGKEWLKQLHIKGSRELILDGKPITVSIRRLDGKPATVSIRHPDEEK